MTAMTMNANYVTDKALAERLEVFEQNLQLQDQLAATNAKLKEREAAHAEELSRERRLADDPVQIAIDILQSHQQYQDKLTQAERQRDLFDNENIELREHVNELTDAGVKLKQLAGHYQDQCEKLLAKHNADVQKAQAEIDRVTRQNALLAVEVKDLRALNPQRLAKQVKELQKKNKDLVEGNQQLRTLANANQKIRKEHEERGRIIDRLHTDNRRLDAALSEACDQMNTGSKVQPIEEHGDWAIYGHKDGTEALIIHHQPSDSSRVYWAGTGFQKAPAVPARIKTRAEEMIANFINTKASMIDYVGGEQVEVA